MGSLNISITEDVYIMLKRMKKTDQSFSDIIRSLIKEKDISRCYGLLRGDQNLDIVEKEALKARKQRWKVEKFENTP